MLYSLLNPMETFLHMLSSAPVTALGAILLLGACGLKAPLILPPPTTPPAAAKAGAATPAIPPVCTPEQARSTTPGACP